MADLQARLVAYAPNGARAGILPQPVGWSAAVPLNDVPSAAVEYTAGSAGAARLATPCEVAVEYSADGGATWTEPWGARYLRLRRGDDNTDPVAKRTYSLPGYAWVLGKALLYPSGLDVEGQRVFTAVTVGSLVKTLIDEAKARGALSGLTYDFSATVDSAGQAWSDTVNVTLNPGVNILTVLASMGTQLQVDWITAGRVLKMFKPDSSTGLGRNLATGTSPKVLRYGRDIVAAPDTGTLEDVLTDVLALGDEGLVQQENNPAASSPWGRWEGSVQQGGVTDTTQATAFAQATLAANAREKVEATRELNLTGVQWLPFVDYRVGDYISAPDDTGALASQRVRQITLTGQSSGLVGGNVVLNDRLTEASIAALTRIAAILNGSTATGGSGTTPTPVTPEGPDTTIPAQVTGLQYSSLSYIDPLGTPRAQVTLTWGAVTTNVGGSAIDDLDVYEVWERQNSVGTVWRQRTTTASGDVTVTLAPYDVASNWLFKVRARDTSNNSGAFSSPDLSATMTTDSTPPATPSTPTTSVKLGTARIVWDGKNSGGSAMDADFAYVALHISATNGFTPSSTSYVTRLYGAAAYTHAGAAYGTPYYVKLVAYDTSGNPSAAASAQATFTVTQLVTGDLGDQTVTTGKLVANAVTTDKIDVGAITAELIALGVLRTNMVADPSFEEDYAFTAFDPFGQWAGEGNTYGNVDQWRRGNATGSSSVTRSVGVGRSRSGRAAASLYTSGSTYESSMWTSSMPTVSGRTYRVTVMAVSLSAAGTLVVQAYHHSTAYISGMEGGPTLNGDQTTWVKPPVVSTPVEPSNFYTYSWTFVASNAWVAIRVLNYHPTSASTVVIDDVSCVEVGTGGSVEVTAAGLRLFDDEGYEATAMVTNRPHVISVANRGVTLASIDSTGYATFTGMTSRGDIAVDGSALIGSAEGELFPGSTSPYQHSIIESLPLGVVQWGKLTSTGPNVTTTEKGYIEIAAPIYHNRTYVLRTNALRVRTTADAPTTAAELNVYITTGTAGTPSNWPSTPLVASSTKLCRVTPQFIPASIGASMTLSYLWKPDPGAVTDHAFAYNARLLLALKRVAGSGTLYVDADTTDFVEFWLEDIGPARVNGGQANPGDGTVTGVPLRTVSTTYASTSFKSYKGDGTERTGTDVTGPRQGYSYANGDQKGVWIFPDMTGDLAGATITRVRAYLRAENWSGESGTAKIGVHNYSSAPASSPTITANSSHTAWGDGVAKWVDLPDTSGMYAGLVAGTVKGLAVGPAGTEDRVYTGKFAAGATLEIQYYK